MTCRILMVAACSGVFGSSSLAAQQAALRPHPSALFVTPAVAADSMRPAPTYWKEGAITGGAIVGLTGALAMNGLCHMDDANASGCGLAALGGAALGFLIGAVPGALIGGQIHKSE
jgi:hypothetical protein